MMIRCPECEFARSIDETKIPSTAQVATCPRCKVRFRFRNVEGGDDFAHTSGPGNTNLGSDLGAGFNQNSNANQHGEQPGSYGQPDQPNTPDNSGHPDNLGDQFDQNFDRDDNSPNPANRAGQHEGQKPKKGGQPRDIWDHIASLGEKWGDSNKQSGQGGAYQGQGQGHSSNPQASDFGENERGGPVPFEDMVRYGVFGGYVQTLKRVMLHSRIFFSAMPGLGEIGRPILFYLVTYIIQLFATLFWINSLYTLPEPLQEMMADISLLQILLAAIMQAVTGLCFIAILCTLALRLGGVKNVRIIKTLRIVCYSCAGLILGIVPFFGPIMSFLWVLMCMYQGFLHGYGITRGQAVGALLPVCLLLLFFVSLSMSVF